MSESDDADLARRAASGNESAFETLVERYRSRVFGTASRFARGRQELDDLAQDIFLRVWKGLGSFRKDAPFEHWFMRIAIRTCYDHLRKHRRRRESEILCEETPAEREADHTTPSIRNRREAWELVQKLMTCLSDKDQLLIDLEERSVKETAVLTGWSESNVKVRAHRARKRMRKYHKELTGNNERV